MIVAYHIAPDEPDFLIDDPEEFDDERALAVLLVNGVVFLNNRWWHNDLSDEARLEHFNVIVNCSDTFAYASADGEDLPWSELRTLWRFFAADSTWGPTAWCVRHRAIKPIHRVGLALKAAGYDLENLKPLEGQKPPG